MIAWDKIKAVKGRTQLFQATQAVLQGLHVYGSTLMAPVAQEHASFATVFLSSLYKPINEICTILIVHQTVALEAKVDIGAYSNFTK
jgi:hypothetical protein